MMDAYVLSQCRLWGRVLELEQELEKAREKADEAEELAELVEKAEKAEKEA